MKKFIALLSCCFLVLFIPAPIFAASICDSGAPGCTCEVKDAAGKAIASDVPSLACFAPIISNVINFLFMFLGATALIFLIYGAIRFVVSGGDQKALQSARGTMTYAVIGLVLILLSYVIINTVTTALGLGNLLDKFTLFQK